MKKIKTLEQYEALIRENKERYPKQNTNGYFYVDQVGSMLEEERLKYEISDNGLVFAVDEGKYYELYYFFDKNKTFTLPDIELDKPLCLSEFDRNDRRAEYISTLEDYLIPKGFEKFVMRQYRIDYEAKKEKIAQEARDSMDEIIKLGYEVIDCDQDCYPQILALVERYLPIFDHHYRDLDFLGSDQYRCKCVVDTQKRVLCFTLYRSNRFQDEGLATITNPAINRTVRAILLERISHWSGIEAGMKEAIGWIRLNNRPAEHMAKFQGFELTGMNKTQFLLN